VIVGEEIVGNVAILTIDVVVGGVARWRKNHTKTNWQFNTDDVRIKLKRLYPSTRSCQNAGSEEKTRCDRICLPALDSNRCETKTIKSLRN
jgi:hypothetical protein